MKTPLVLLLSSLLFSPVFLQAQEDRKPPVLYLIAEELTSESPQEAIDAFKEQIKAKEIEFMEYPNGYHFVRAKLKGDWMVLEQYVAFDESAGDYQFQGYYPLGRKGYDVEMPDTAIYQHLSRYVVTKKGKHYLAALDYDSYTLALEDTYSFEELEVLTMDVGMEEFDPMSEEVTIRYRTWITQLRIKRNDQWGIALWHKDQIEPITNFNFEQKADLPDSLFEYFRDFNSYPDVTFDSVAISKAQSVIDEAPGLDYALYRWSPLEDKDIYIAYKESLMVLIYFQKGQGITYVVEADEIQELGADAFWVRQGDKVGFYSPDLIAHTEIIYDRVEQLFLDSRYGCVTVLNEAYELYDCKTAQKLIPGKASSIEELKEMWLNRN